MKSERRTPRGSDIASWGADVGGVEAGDGRFGAAPTWQEADVEVRRYPATKQGARRGDVTSIHMNQVTSCVCWC